VDSWSLRQVVEQGQLTFECNNCWRLAAVDVLDLVERFGADATVGRIRRQTICRICHTRGARALVRLKGMRKDRAWLPVPPRASR
jgi:hypothetical protein